MHIVPDVDDGADDIEMSLEMLRAAQEQGAKRIICASHNWCAAANRDAYLRNLEELRRRAKDEKIDVDLYPGNEIFCRLSNIVTILEELNNGIILPLNGTRFVLVEFDTHVLSMEVRTVIQKLISDGWKPVIAHAERYGHLVPDDIAALRTSGCLIQINAYSLSDEHSDAIKNKAREILKRQTADFIGSDAHDTWYRPPKYRNGVKYILENCDLEYAQELLWNSAEKLL